jgi:hypothetical protein
MTEKSDLVAIERFIQAYIACVRSNLDERNEVQSPAVWYHGETSSVILALIARQCTLTIKLAQCPGNWDGHTAPLFLRSMVDCHISLAWLLKDPEKRCRELMAHALGQAKLAILNYTEAQQFRPNDQLIDKLIEARTDWVQMHQRLDLTEVNFGSWSGSTTRQMAQDIDDEDFYKFVYTPFSACVHNTWEHVHIYNSATCRSPLHKYHSVGVIRETPIDLDYVFRSSKYLSMSLRALDEAIGLDAKAKDPCEFFDEYEFKSE